MLRMLNAQKEKYNAVKKKRIAVYLAPEEYDNIQASTQRAGLKAIYNLLPWLTRSLTILIGKHTVL